MTDWRQQQELEEEQQLIEADPKFREAWEKVFGPYAWNKREELDKRVKQLEELSERQKRAFG